MTHGITITEDSSGTRSLAGISTAVIGVIVTGPDADAAVFPLGQAVRIANMAAAIAAAGATGTIRGVLQAIDDQVSTDVVVVRVATDPDAGDQDALVIGGVTNGIANGLQALLVAEANLGVKPRILGAPGLDTQPVTTALVVVAQKLRAFGYARAIGADPAAAQAYRANFSARELMLIWDDFLAFDVDAKANATSFATARALGLRARLDQEQGWHKTLSNVAVDGVVGIAHPLQFDIMDTASQAGVLNAKQVTALVRTDGFRFWGNRTCAEDGSSFAFESATRTAQVLIDTIGEGMAWAIDKPLTPSLIKDIVETINGALRQMVVESRLLGGKCWFDKDKNGTGALATGKLVIDYDYSPVPPLESLGLIQHITDSYEATLYSAASVS